MPPAFADALARVPLGRLGSEVLFYPTIGSTNDAAAGYAAIQAAEARGNAEGLVVWADAQTAGRGRRGRSWFSPAGSGLYVSVVLVPGAARVDPDRATMLLTLTAGVAIAEGIETATGLRGDLKWPNDVCASRRKLAGILAEAMPAAAGARANRAAHDDEGGEARNGTTVARRRITVVLGYGINVGSIAYPPELSGRVTSIENEVGRPVDRAAVLAATLAALSTRYEDLLDGRFDAILDAWRSRAPSAVGARVTWQAPGGPQSGVTAGIDDRGALLIAVGDRIERFLGGELTWW
jgi:BirA family transcriptional regulator, biotin operon repressor / biotin---[acetyl-CoA-carboxylase] ligase